MTVLGEVPVFLLFSCGPGPWFIGSDVLAWLVLPICSGVSPVSLQYVDGGLDEVPNGNGLSVLAWLAGTGTLGT